MIPGRLAGQGSMEPPRPITPSARWRFGDRSFGCRHVAVDGVDPGLGRFDLGLDPRVLLKQIEKILRGDLSWAGRMRESGSAVLTGS